jgi:hypothetical protein
MICERCGADDSDYALGDLQEVDRVHRFGPQQFTSQSTRGTDNARKFHSQARKE